MTDTYSVIELLLDEELERLLMIAAKAENMAAEQWILKRLRAELFPTSELLSGKLQK